VVVELKTVDFEPEFAGKLNFYLKTVDEQLRSTSQKPSSTLFKRDMQFVGRDL
jgi:hypothetical protein